MKQFDIPVAYRSTLISEIKNLRKQNDKLKADFSPTELDFGPVVFYIARHFGFCYGVENAIEIIYKVIQEHKGQRIFLLSEMIHNPLVNQDLMEQGVQFIQDTSGNMLMEWEDLKAEDVVVIPAFGTTVEIEEKLKSLGVQMKTYDTTCPFVEKVWKRSAKLGEDQFTIVIHGKAKHEETRATFSHAKEFGPAVIVQNLKEAEALAKYINKEKSPEAFYEEFKGKYSEGFNPEKDLKSLGVVNQTTMLATETQEIADFLKSETIQENGEGFFADTRDTLCYATSDNQKAVYGMLEKPADFAFVVGGYNSSNTSHLVELCEEKLTTYHISTHEEIKEDGSVHSYKFREDSFQTTAHFIPSKEKVKILITGGASCPDVVVDKVIAKTLSFFPNALSPEQVTQGLFN